MAKLGKTSIRRLSTCDTRLQCLVKMVEKDYPRDFAVVAGHRGRAAQEKAFCAGHSKAHFGESRHNESPSMAVGIAPYGDGGVLWDAGEDFALLATYMLAAALKMGWPITWGGHFKSLRDLPHFELKGD